MVTTAGGAEIDVGAEVVVDLSLGQHAIVLEHGFAEVGTIARNDHHLHVPLAQRLQRLAVSYPAFSTSLLPSSALPDFITMPSFALMFSVAIFFGIS